MDELENFMDALLLFFPLIWGFCTREFTNYRLVFLYGPWAYDHAYERFDGVLSEQGRKGEGSLSKLLFNVLAIVLISILVLFVIDIWMVKNNADVAGIFGDFFGGVLNPILTFCTFLGLIVTIFVQRQDLKLSRVEYEKTAEALTTQSVENTFFNILDLHHKIADNLKFNSALLMGAAEHKANVRWVSLKASAISYTSKPESVMPIVISEGRAVFDDILQHLNHGSATPRQMLERYKEIQSSHNHILGHYFRNLYQALKVMDGYDESVVSEASKFKYASILRAQLSTKELSILFVNCLDNVCDKGQFRNYLIKYEMLEHLHCRPESEKYRLGGEGGMLATRSMLLQYQTMKRFAKLDLDKYYGGAFGKNLSIPYDLSKDARYSEQE